MQRFVPIAAIMLCQPVLAESTIYEVTFSESSGVKMLNVDFHESKPPSDLAEEVLRSSLDVAISVDPTQNIVATLFYRDEMVRGDAYESQLVYVAEDAAIVLMSEYLERY